MPFSLEAQHKEANRSSSSVNFLLKAGEYLQLNDEASISQSLGQWNSPSLDPSMFRAWRPHQTALLTCYTPAPPFLHMLIVVTKDNNYDNKHSILRSSWLTRASLINILARAIMEITERGLVGGFLLDKICPHSENNRKWTHPTGESTFWTRNLPF